MTYKRYNVNAPLDLAAMIDARILECPYDSPSNYFLALAIFDCWSRREHKLTVKLMSFPPRARDEAFTKVAEEYRRQSEALKAGTAKPEEQKLGWFDHFIKKIVQEEIRKASAEAASVSKAKRKPGKQKPKPNEGDSH
jgi:hypothetical protein